MTMRTGWTFNGKHFAETRTTRMGAPRFMFFIDGKPTPHAAWRAEMAVARAADADKAAVEEILKETGA